MLFLLFVFVDAISVSLCPCLFVRKLTCLGIAQSEVEHRFDYWRIFHHKRNCIRRRQRIRFVSSYRAHAVYARARACFHCDRFIQLNCINSLRVKRVKFCLIFCRFIFRAACVLVFPLFGRRLCAWHAFATNMR